MSTTRTRTRRALLAPLLAMLIASVLSAGGPAQAAGGTDDDAPRFDFTRYAEVTPPDGWSFVAGQFAGNRRADVVGYHPSNGSLWVGRTTGSSFAFTKYAEVGPAADWSFVAGQFTGDRRADVVGYHPSNGTLWVGRNAR